MSLEDEVDAAALEAAARLDILVLRGDWFFLASPTHRFGRARKIYQTYDRFRSPEHVVAIVEGKEPYDGER
jgi:hypothetical protein